MTRAFRGVVTRSSVAPGRARPVEVIVRRALLLVGIAVVGCKKDDPGALVGVSADSTVGVVLDDIPPSERDAVAAQVLGRDAAFWEARAAMQMEATLYRLVYRNFYYDDVGQLPLPPREAWDFQLGAAERLTIDGHDLVVVDYTFTSTLLTGFDQPTLAEPLLTDVGGIWEEEYVLPVDPDLLLERTGYACMDEADFPPNSVDTENARFFFDDYCEPGETDCHITEFPELSCVDSLVANVGTVETAVVFERLAWDEAVADAARVGSLEPGIAQLEAVEAGLEDNRVIYKYIPEGSCAIAEGCVGASGWRRLLQFTATTKNKGALDLWIGDVGPGSLAVDNNLVSMSECHEHMHFNHYGDFAFGGDNLGGKRAFCVESTARYFNTEDAPLVHPYGCYFQGTAAGWGDDYIAGLDCQWVDITEVDATGGVTDALSFDANPDGFLCEGEPILDDDGNLTFEATEFTNEQGEAESAIACDEAAGWDADNFVSATVAVPETGGLVTGACERGQLGEMRNCGFTEAYDDATCTPGEAVTMSCTATGGPAVLRVCEASHALDTGVACTYRDALGTGTAVDDGTDVTVAFTCPIARDTVEVGGRYALYTGPLVSGDNAGDVVCTPL